MIVVWPGRVRPGTVNNALISQTDFARSLAKIVGVDVPEGACGDSRELAYVMLGESEITFMHTPGHTAGSGCYIVDGCIFSGDTLFYGSVGRTDFPTSSMSDMMRSVARLGALDGEYNVYPGHEMFTTLSFERKYNPFMR